jgi:hypothetical protein
MARRALLRLANALQTPDHRYETTAKNYLGLLQFATLAILLWRL